MISRWILSSLCLCLIIVNAPPAVEGRYAIVPRQQSPSPTDQQAPTTGSPSPNADSVEASPKADQTAAPSAAASSSLRTTLDKSKATSSAQGSSTSDAKASSSSSSDPAVLTATPIGNSSLILPSDTAQNGTEDLPITPTVTPALAVAGAFLMLTGIFYTLIGIKTKWLHIFLSTAYLTSLATTVLIVYVMHPPVSNAIQGAYFVAAFVTGVIFGGGSIIFTDVTEGLGCLLGGYCLAMWFLVLTPGGLIRSTAGKAIFIACFTVGAFGFYLSHWTRAYGLIGSISFAGATVIVLGVDCFSRAGLKEFWLYIWGLNEDIFPLRYSGPYPMTRGIRVEIAAIIIIFLVGVMSQMKIWKIIKRRREERATERSKREQLDDQAEENVGKTIEEGNKRDRSLWEAAYGRTKGADRHVDSGIGTETLSVRKASSSIIGTIEGASPRPESIELNDLERGSAYVERDALSPGKGKGKARAAVTVRVASDDDVARSDYSSASTNNGCEARDVALDGPSSRAGKNKASASPDIVPLPFKVPDPDSSDDKRSSIGASMASEHFSTLVLKRLSGGSLKRTSSKKSRRSYMATSTSEEALMIPYGDDDDRASSVEAAVDEVSDGNRSEADEADEADGTTLAGLPSPSADELLKFSPPTEPHPMERPERKISKMSLGQYSSRSAQAREGPTTEDRIEDSEVVVDHAPRNQDANLESEASDPTGKPQDPLKTSNSDTPSNVEQPFEKPALRDSLANLDGTSKVVMAYRTNEWAKHLDRAEKPSLDDLRSIRAAAEKPAPLNIPALQQTPLNASPAPALPNLNTSPHISRSASSNSQDSLPLKSPLNQQRSSSQTSLDSLPSQQAARAHQARRISSSSAHNPQAPHRVSRGHASTPITNTPIDEDIPSTTFPQRSSFTQPTLPTSNTLMSRRESLLQSRPSSTSLTRGAAYTPLSRTSSPKILDGGDNIPLSHRRVSLQQQQQQQQRRSSSSQMLPSPSAAAASAYPYPYPAPLNPSHSPTPAQQPSAYPFPSPSPSPSSPLNLRASAHLKEDQSLHNRRSDLLIQKRRSDIQNQQATVAKRNSEREMDARWRASGAGMEERHREAMRRMQAGVGG